MDQVYPVPNALAKAAHVDKEGYQRLYRRSVEDPEGFWGEQAKRLDWMKAPTKIKNTSFSGDVSIK